MIDVEKRAESAAELFVKGYNCCQAVVLAFADVVGLDEKTLACLGSGFGGGFGRLREVCGCMSGMTVIAGLLCPADDPSDSRARTENYALVQRFAAAYKQEMGSIVCREILGMKAQKSPESPKPSERNAAYYATRPCARSCAVAARIVARYLIEQGL